jgi:hypothetical protein
MFVVTTPGPESEIVIFDAIIEKRVSHHIPSFIHPFYLFGEYQYIY